MTPLTHLLTKGIVTSLCLGLLTASHALMADVEEDNEPKPTETTKTCEEGHVWDAEKEKCISIKDTSFNDDIIYQQARELAYANRHQDAIALLEQAQNTNNPKILNYLGFSHRKAGNMDTAMSYYNQAITIDPNYILARSYMGQGLVTLGKIDLAKAQLQEIQQRGGKGTPAYDNLARAIEFQTSDY